MKKKCIKCCIIFFLLCSCRAYQNISIQYSLLQIKPTTTSSDTLARFLKSYRKALKDSLQQVVAFSNHTWLNKAPDYALANLLADAIWTEVSIQDSLVAGVLMPATIIQGYLPKGNITALQLYQMLPENKIWGTIKMQGNRVLSLLEQLMKQGGWTVSQNIQIVKKNDQGLLITLSGKPLQKNLMYSMVLVLGDTYTCGKEKRLPPDFHWGRGDLRQMLVEYCIRCSRKGKPLPLLQGKRVYAGDY